MIRQTIDLFLKRQYMNDLCFEIYNYSDEKIPKVIPHKHDFFEIYYLLCDDVEYYIGNQIYQMKKGDFLLIPPGLLHYPSSIHTGENNHYARFVLWCNIDFFDTFVKIDPEVNQMWDTVIQNRAYQISPSPGASYHLKDLFLRLLSEREKKDFASNGMMYSILLDIFVTVNRIVHTTEHFKKHTPTVKLFDNIIYYIHAHLTEDLSLDLLADRFFVSKGYISKLFREYMGIPVYQYILSLRLDGCRKAIQSGASITNIVELYGFSDYSNFYRAFKSAFQVSPRQYQQSCREPEKQ